jgi:hypothetical protein
MIPSSATNDVKEAIAQFRDLVTKALKAFESAAESGSTSLAISGLLESTMLSVVHWWLSAVQMVPHKLQTASVYADMVLRALYGDEATVENYQSIRWKKQKRTIQRNTGLSTPRPQSINPSREYGRALKSVKEVNARGQRRLASS